MDTHEIKKQVQAILGDGIVVIVGCGLSSAEGIPGMHELSKHLIEAIPYYLSSEEKQVWTEIELSLNSGVGLEQALDGKDLTKSLNDAITQETSKLIGNAERKIINEIISSNKVLRFSSLAKALPPWPNNISVLTTNYDRLIEIACEAVGKRVDSSFIGHSIAVFDPKESLYTFCKGIRKKQGKICLDYAPRIKVLKPHGSLDWYYIGGRPVRCPYDIEQPPLLIIPGGTKYRAGYNEPFDAHREAANQKIDQAKRYLIIGYGFNDDHLQTHLERNLIEGKLALIISRDLSDSAIELLNKSPNMMALYSDKSNPGNTIFRNYDGATYSIQGNFWDLGNLVEEVFI